MAEYLENELYQQWKSSDETTRSLLLPSLVGALRKHALSVCWLRIPDHPGEHEWVAAEAIWRIVQNLEKFAGEAKFGTWTHRVILNECNRLLKSRQRLRVEVPIEESPSLFDENSSSPVSEVSVILATLDPDSQLIVQGRLEGLTFQEIGALLGITAEATRKRWQKVKAELK